MVDLTEALTKALLAYEHEASFSAAKAAFLASLAASGYAIVPREATEDMHNAARDWSLNRYSMAIGRDASEGCWRAMLAAAILALGEKK